MRRQLWFFFSLTAAGLAGTPLLAYAVGTRLAGRYAGEGGIGGYLASIYSGALHGEIQALPVLLAVPLLLLIWRIILSTSFR